MTTAINNRVQDIGFEEKTPYPIDTSGSFDINQGDLCYIDTSAHKVKPATSDANCATLVGVAADTSFRNLYGTKNYDTGTLQVYSGGLFFFNTTAAETYNEGTKVYYGADAQTLTNVAGTNALGVCKMRPGVASVTGAAGTTVDIQIVPQWPFKSAL